MTIISGQCAPLYEQAQSSLTFPQCAFWNVSSNVSNVSSPPVEWEDCSLDENPFGLAMAIRLGIFWLTRWIYWDILGIYWIYWDILAYKVEHQTMYLCALCFGFCRQSGSTQTGSSMCSRIARFLKIHPSILYKASEISTEWKYQMLRCWRSKTAWLGWDDGPQLMITIYCYSSEGQTFLIGLCLFC